MPKLQDRLEAELESEFQFTNRFTSESGLLHLWNEGRILVAPSPPYRQGLSELLLNKAIRGQAELIVLLLPCDVSTEWFNRAWELSRTEPELVELRFFNGRIKYEGVGPESYRVSSCLVIIRHRTIERSESRTA